MVGTGELCYVTKHGISYFTPYAPHPHMVALAQQAAQKHPQLRVIGKEMLILEEVANLWRRGYKAHLPSWLRRQRLPPQLAPPIRQPRQHPARHLKPRRPLHLALLQEIDQQ